MTMYKTFKNFVGETVILNQETKTSFLPSPDNTDYQAYLKWLAEGNEPLPAEEN